MDLSAVNYTHMDNISRSLYMSDSGGKSLFVTWGGGGTFIFLPEYFVFMLRL